MNFLSHVNMSVVGVGKRGEGGGISHIYYFLENNFPWSMREVIFPQMEKNELLWKTFSQHLTTTKQEKIRNIFQKTFSIIPNTPIV